MSNNNTHPYVPKDLSLPGYVPITLSVPVIFGVFAAVAFVFVSLAWILPWMYSKITRVERALICWWVFTGLTHIIVEGYFAFSPHFYRNNHAFYLAELWKEYSKSDSRYVTRNAAVVTLEGITAVFEGPGSLLAAYAIARHKSYRDALQLSVSLGQLYGCAMYFITAILEGDKFAVNRYYYWVYYIGANSPWLLIPPLICIRSWRRISESFQGDNTILTETKSMC